MSKQMLLSVTDLSEDEVRKLLQLQSMEKAKRSSPGPALRSARRLAGLVEMLLDVSRIATGRLELSKEDVDLVQLARDAIDRYSDEARRVGSEVLLEGDASVRGSWDALRLVPQGE